MLFVVMQSSSSQRKNLRQIKKALSDLKNQLKKSDSTTAKELERINRDIDEDNKNTWEELDKQDSLIDLNMRNISRLTSDIDSLAMSQKGISETTNEIKDTTEWTKWAVGGLVIILTVAFIALWKRIGARLKKE
jgi:phenylalanine-4-hydroxylase